jgi:glycerate kinase
MGHLLAAPDKFRGTADASQVAHAAACGALRAGWTASELPLADGGDGLLAAFEGEVHHDQVTGPLGTPVVADWKLVAGTSDQDGPLAVIEMANASGLALAGGDAYNDPMKASTVGTGELIARAIALGAKRVIVGCGGSATTDGGIGALGVLPPKSALAGIKLVAACDVTTNFVDAARVFGPQKGATPEQVQELTVRLSEIAGEYRSKFGVDVSALAGAGAAGGLAGGLAALGATIVSGFDLVADYVGLDHHLASADIVMTGEGHLDRQSFSGKVVGGVIRHVAGRVPVLCVTGQADSDVDSSGFALASLAARFGLDRARHEVLALVEQVVAEYLSTHEVAQ